MERCAFTTSATCWVREGLWRCGSQVVALLEGSLVFVKTIGKMPIARLPASVGSWEPEAAGERPGSQRSSRDIPADNNSASSRINPATWGSPGHMLPLSGAPRDASAGTGGWRFRLCRQPEVKGWMWSLCVKQHVRTHFLTTLPNHMSGPKPPHRRRGLRIGVVTTLVNSPRARVLSCCATVMLVMSACKPAHAITPLRSHVCIARAPLVSATRRMGGSAHAAHARPEANPAASFDLGVPPALRDSSLEARPSLQQCALSSSRQRLAGLRH